MPLTGKAKTEYMREFMRRKRAAARAGSPVHRETEPQEARIKQVEAELAKTQAAEAERLSRHVTNGDAARLRELEAELERKQQECEEAWRHSRRGVMFSSDEYRLLKTALSPG